MGEHTAGAVEIGRIAAGEDGEVLGLGLRAGAANGRVQHPDTGFGQPGASALFVFQRECAGLNNQKIGATGGRHSPIAVERIFERSGVRERRDDNIGLFRHFARRRTTVAAARAQRIHIGRKQIITGGVNARRGQMTAEGASHDPQPNDARPSGWRAFFMAHGLESSHATSI